MLESSEWDIRIGVSADRKKMMKKSQNVPEQSRAKEDRNHHWIHWLCHSDTQPLWRGKKGVCFNLYQLSVRLQEDTLELSNFKHSEREWKAFNPWIMEINYKSLIIVDFNFFKGGWD